MIWNHCYTLEDYKYKQSYEAREQAEQAPFVPAVSDRSMNKAQWRLFYGHERSKDKYRKRFAEWNDSSHRHSPQGRWLAKSSICPHCWADISNRQYWGNNGRGSAHFRRTCGSKGRFKVPIPKPSWKLPYRTLIADVKGWEPQISDLETLQKYWNGELKTWDVA